MTPAAARISAVAKQLRTRDDPVYQALADHLDNMLARHAPTALPSSPHGDEVCGWCTDLSMTGRLQLWPCAEMRSLQLMLDLARLGG